MKHGDFTNLAASYAQFRPGYAPTVLRAILAQASKPTAEIDFVDVGAGTGIWTRMVAEQGCRSVRAVEPNDEMRAHGEKGNGGLNILWSKGDGAATGLADNSCDLLTMASSFHWVDYTQGTAEFTRVLRPGGWFAALWNTRFLESDPLLMEIEDHLQQLVPNLKRISSGRSEFCDTLTKQMLSTLAFDDVLQIEGFHVEEMTPQRYIGIWESVNDVRVQAGPDRFARFLDFIRERTADLASIRASYQTRAWMARNGKA